MDQIKDGPAKRLMLDGLTDNDTKDLPFEYCPIALLASKRGSLGQLDHLLAMFEIESGGDPSFKAKLSEKKWIEEVKGFQGDKEKLINKISKKSPMNALSELFVARYIREKTPHKIIKLAANSGDARPDVETKDAYIEVKYLAAAPQFIKGILDNLEDFPRAQWVDENAMINYFYIRLAEAATQLEKENTKKLKLVWFVFDEMAKDNKKLFQKDVMNLPCWRSGLDDLLAKLSINDEKKTLFKSKTPNQWLQRPDGLLLSIYNTNWSLSDVVLLSNDSMISHQPNKPLYGRWA